MADNLLLTNDGGGEAKETPKAKEDVRIGCVPKVDAIGVNFLQQGYDLTVGKFRAIKGGQTHTAIAELRDVETLRT